MKKPFIWIVLIAALALAVLAFALTRPDTPQPTEPTTLPTTQAAEPTAPTTQATQPTQTTAPTQPPQTTVPTAPPTQPPTQPPHVHAYEDVVKEPTCTEGGYTTHTCSVCGDTYTDSEKDALGHSFGQWITVKEPTEAEEGKQERTCANCGTKEEKTLPKQEHVHDYTSEVTAPTCTEGGYTTYTCACGDTYTADKTAALGHDYETKVTQPTCTEKGYTLHTCTRCNISYKDTEVPALGHTWGEWITVKNPTETEVGKKERTCDACGEKEEAVIPKLEHQHAYTAKIIAPTCTEQGYTEYTCACGDSYKEDYTDALGHSYVKTVVEATCTTEGYTTYTCSACSASYTDGYVDALGHSFEETVTEPTCTEKGKIEKVCTVCSLAEITETAALGHTWSESGTPATCTEPGSISKTCTVCGAKETETSAALGHDWTEWETTKVATTTEEGEKIRSCKRCNLTETETIPVIEEEHKHTWEITYVDVTCTTDGYKQKLCTVCGKVYQTVTEYAPGHDWSAFETTLEPQIGVPGEEQRTCARCNEVETVAIPPLDENGQEYESYIDPEISVLVIPSATLYHYGNIHVKDFRSWGEDPSIWVNEDGSLTVAYYNLEGERIEFKLDPPPEGYVLSCSIEEDGKWYTGYIGDFG